MNDAYKIFKQLQEEEKIKKPYINEDKDGLLNIIIEKDEEIENLQTRWDSLREWLKEGTKEPIYEKGDMFWKEACENVLDKMNELEGGDNEKSTRDD